MKENQKPNLRDKVFKAILSFPVRLKIAGIVALPVALLGISLNYWVQTGLSDWLSRILEEERVHIAMQNGSRSVLMVTGLITILSLLITYLLTLLLTKPLLELSQVAKRVTDGNLSSRATIWSGDEIGEVAGSINLMLEQLESNQQELEQSNRYLEAINRVSIAVGRQLDLQDVLDTALHTTLEVMRLEDGWIYLRSPNKSGRANYQLASFRIADDTLLEKIKTQEELCQCQNDLISGKLGLGAATHPCLRLCPNENPDMPKACHITIPLEASGQQFGVMNLLCPDTAQPLPEDLEMLSTVGSQTSEFIANAWLHSNLIEKEIARQALLKALVSTQENERARLSRQLHDNAGQRLTSLLIRLKSLENQVSLDGLKKEIDTLCQSVSETIEQVQSIAYWLRPAALEEFGLKVALRTLIQEMLEHGGIATDYELALDEQRLSFEIETCLYRIAQESFTNIVRHSAATHVLVDLEVTPKEITLLVKDNGVGFDPSSAPNQNLYKHFGLMNIKERAEMLGGSLKIGSSAGEGTTILVKIPLNIEEKSND